MSHQINFRSGIISDNKVYDPGSQMAYSKYTQWKDSDIVLSVQGIKEKCKVWRKAQNDHVSSQPFYSAKMLLNYSIGLPIDLSSRGRRENMSEAGDLYQCLLWWHGSRLRVPKTVTKAAYTVIPCMRYPVFFDF